MRWAPNGAAMPTSPACPGSWKNWRGWDGTTPTPHSVNCSPPASSPMEAPNNSARSEEHTSELQSLMRISYAVFCLKKKHYLHISPHISPASNTHTQTYFILLILFYT